MTIILTLVDNPRDGETFQQAIARRLNGEFGQLRLSMSKAAKLAGMSQSQFSRRMTGALPFDVVELERLCSVLNLDRNYVLTGARSLDASPPSLPDGDGDDSPNQPVAIFPLAQTG